MWDWEVVDEVEPIALLYSNPWELLLCLLIILCYAMLVDVVWVSETMTYVRLLINGSIKGGNFNTHMGVIN